MPRIGGAIAAVLISADKKMACFGLIAFVRANLPRPYGPFSPHAATREQWKNPSFLPLLLHSLSRAFLHCF
jgi:hypothetical protein